MLNEYTKQYLINWHNDIYINEWVWNENEAPFFLGRQINLENLQSIEPSASTGQNFMGQIQSHSQGKDQSLPAGFSEADLHKALRSVPFIPHYSFGSLISSSLFSGILQTVCYLDPNKSFSERNYIRGKQSREKLPILSCKYFNFYHSSRRIIRMATYHFLLKVPTKISQAKKFFWKVRESLHYIINHLQCNILFLKYFWRWSQNSFAKELNKHKFNFYKRRGI